MHRLRETYRKEFEELNHNRPGKGVINVVSAVLNGHSAVISLAGYHCNGFSTITSQRKQKRFQSRIAGVNPGDDIFFTAARFQ
jgi:hypothetical protein